MYKFQFTRMTLNSVYELFREWVTFKRHQFLKFIFFYDIYLSDTTSTRDNPSYQIQSIFQQTNLKLVSSETTLLF